MKKPNIATLLLLTLVVSACGKNMAVSLKGAATPTTPTGTTPDTNGGKNGENLNATKASPTPTPDAKTIAPDANATSTLAAIEGQLEPLSTYDGTLLTALPFLDKESGDDYLRPLGSPTFILEDGSNGFVKASNVVFRALKQVPDKESIKEVTKFSLILKNVRRFNPAGADVKTLAKQVLCILPAKICSGDVADANDPASANLNQIFWKGTSGDGKDAATLTGPMFSNIDVSKTSVLLESKDTLAGADSIEIDLFDAFGIDRTNTAAVVQWIYDNSTAFTDVTNHYRKFSFVMGNNIYADSGELDLTFAWNGELPKDFAQIAGTPTNGPTDLTTPKRTDPEVVKGSVGVTGLAPADKIKPETKTEAKDQTTSAPTEIEKAKAPEVVIEKQKPAESPKTLGISQKGDPNAVAVKAVAAAPALPAIDLLNLPSADMEKRALAAGRAQKAKAAKTKASAAAQKATVRKAVEGAIDQSKAEISAQANPSNDPKVAQSVTPAVNALGTKVEARVMKKLYPAAKARPATSSKANTTTVRKTDQNGCDITITTNCKNAQVHVK